VDVADVKERIGGIPGCYVVKGYNPQDLSDALKLALDYDYTNYKSIEYAKPLDENLLVMKLIDIYNSLVK
jgi:hypothetical protein